MTFKPFHLFAGACIVGAIGATILLVGKEEAATEEGMFRQACSKAMSNHTGKPVNKVTSYPNAAGGYTVYLNIEEGPSLTEGKFLKDPGVSWGAECGTDGNGQVFFMGTYDFERDNHLIWSKGLGWVRLSDVRKKMVPDELLQDTPAKLKDEV